LNEKLENNREYYDVKIVHTRKWSEMIWEWWKMSQRPMSYRQPALKKWNHIESQKYCEHFSKLIAVLSRDWRITNGDKDANKCKYLRMKIYDK
jgi:hypothetical protein